LYGGFDVAMLARGTCARQGMPRGRASPA
jgi:hypothetical protein